MTQNKPKRKTRVTEKIPKKISQARTQITPKALKRGKQGQTNKHIQNDQTKR